MKRLWIALLLLAAIGGATVYNGLHLRQFTGTLTDGLEQAAVQAEAGNWAAARQTAGQVADRWMEREQVLHVLLRHGDMDAIQIGLEELLVLLEHQDISCSVTIRRLITQMELLWQAEQLTLSNLF